MTAQTSVKMPVEHYFKKITFFVPSASTFWHMHEGRYQVLCLERNPTTRRPDIKQW